MVKRDYGSYSAESTIASSQYDGSMCTIDEEEGIQYWTPVKIPRGKTINKDYKSDRTVSVTADTAETDSLLGSEDSDIDNMAAKLLAWLGFENNPFSSGADIRNTKAADMRLAMLSNFSTAYNVVSISLALDIMQEIYPASPEDKSLCSSALIAGMIAGQLAGGALGDILGRHVAMTVVMMLQIIGAIVTALSSDGYEMSIYVFIAIWRFVLGLGCGGVYPLAATITAEASSVKQSSSKSIALAFSMQGVGYLAAPLFTALLAFLFPHDHWLCWRCLLGVGARPGICLMHLRKTTQLPVTKTQQTHQTTQYY
jgi:PHS family inorganic phosphate transporter-like MFS transporter